MHNQTLQCIAGEYVTRRKRFKKARLNWRKSGGARRSLGWIPVNTLQRSGKMVRSTTAAIILKCGTATA
ncbi:hypothetical protein TOI97_12620 [Denitrificimonas sp. JX-1]|uniref:Uncharacterized protein n=1 Tax=Denitrificimonas halotolerans TaxID=3098930 RepID=A0ABU5GUT7_9GAMM|nr:hypothetical protein [Denitrificimonas sp. JX-1]MDY7220407.1 hypothetical protein [Denitrificimonas sp. JX-1]